MPVETTFFQQYLVQKLESLEKDQKEQAEVRGKILVILEHLQEEGDEHKMIHIALETRVFTAEGILRAIAISDAQGRGEWQGVKKSWQFVLAIATAVTSTVIYLLDKFYFSGKP